MRAEKQGLYEDEDEDVKTKEDVTVLTDGNKDRDEGRGQGCKQGIGGVLGLGLIGGTK